MPVAEKKTEGIYGYKSVFFTLMVFSFLLVKTSIIYGQEYRAADTIYVKKMIINLIDSPQIDPQRGLLIAQNIFEISEKFDFKEGIADGWYYLGKFYDRTGNLEKSVAFLQKALRYSKENHLRKQEAKSLLFIGYISHRKSDEDTAFSNFTQALNIFKAIKDSVGMAMAYQNIGTCFMNPVGYADAMDNFNKAIEMYKFLNRPHDYGLLYWNIALLHFRLKQFDKGIGYLNESISVFNQIHDTLALCSAYNTLAAYYQDKHNFDSATCYYIKSLSISKNTGNKRQQAITFSNLGLSYYENGDYKTAEHNFIDALVLVKQLHYNEFLNELEHNIAHLYFKIKDYRKAYLYYDSAYIHLDSFRNEEKEKAMAEMTARYNNKELDNKNKILEKENVIEKIKLKQKNIFIYSGFGVAILFLVIGVQVVRQNKLKTNQQKLELEQKQLLAQINPHFIFNCLNSIQQFVVQNDTVNANKYLADFALLMRQTLDNSKDGTISLRREIDYLENYLSFEHMRFEDKFSYAIHCAININPETIEIPSMIIQPFVENAIRHGLCNLETRKGKLDINFYKKDGNLFCEVDDNGIGIEIAKMLKQQSFIKYQSHGMGITQKRLALLSKMKSEEYNITIVNKNELNDEAEGTTIIIKFPLQV